MKSIIVIALGTSNNVSGTKYHIRWSVTHIEVLINHILYHASTNRKTMPKKTATKIGCGPFD